MTSHLMRAATAPASLWDRLGLAVSGVCAVHCLLLPVTLSVLPLWPIAAAFEAWLHPLLALLLVPTTVLAAHEGYRQHRRLHIAVLLGAGLAVVIAAVALGRGGVSEFAEAGLMLAGSALLLTGHWRNWRADRCCDAAEACPRHVEDDHVHEDSAPALAG